MLFAVYLKDQVNVSICNGRNFCRYANMNIYLTFVALVWVNLLFAQPISIEAVRNSCGSGYFIDNESNQPAMVVRGFFCGNSYFYTPISFGDSIKELAFLDQSLFTGVAEDYDSSNHVIGRYGFNEGLLQDLEEFMPNGTPILQLHFEVFVEIFYRLTFRNSPKGFVIGGSVKGECGFYGTAIGYELGIQMPSLFYGGSHYQNGFFVGCFLNRGLPFHWLEDLRERRLGQENTDNQ